MSQPAATPPQALPCVRTVLVIGGGIGGMCAAIALRAKGIAVDLVELKKEWSVYGVGIIQQCNVVRAMSDLGLLDSFLDAGFPFDQVRIYTDAGVPVTTLPQPRAAGPNYPGAVGISRRKLHQVLIDAVIASGTAVRTGLTAAKLDDRGDRVEVLFTDGAHGTYDLVIGADGIYSKTRSAVFPAAPVPRFTGQGVWRYNFRRRPEVDCIVHFEGERGAAGLVPLSQDLMYMFTVSDEPGNPHIPHDTLAAAMRERLAHFTGLVGELREEIIDNDEVVYKPLETVMLPGDWYIGRVLVIGDAAHSTTPHMGQGSGMAIEDAIVIADELAKNADLATALAGFMHRRLERCKFIVDSSVQLGEWQMHPPPDLTPELKGALFHKMIEMTAQPI